MSLIEELILGLGEGRCVFGALITLSDASFIVPFFVARRPLFL